MHRKGLIRELLACAYSYHDGEPGQFHLVRSIKQTPSPGAAV